MVKKDGELRKERTFSGTIWDTPEELEEMQKAVENGEAHTAL